MAASFYPQEVLRWAPPGESARGGPCYLGSATCRHSLVTATVSVSVAFVESGAQKHHGVPKQELEAGHRPVCCIRTIEQCPMMPLGRVKSRGPSLPRHHLFRRASQCWPALCLHGTAACSRCSEGSKGNPAHPGIGEPSPRLRVCRLLCRSQSVSELECDFCLANRHAHLGSRSVVDRLATGIRLPNLQRGVDMKKVGVKTQSKQNQRVDASHTRTRCGKVSPVLLTEVFTRKLDARAHNSNQQTSLQALLCRR